MSREQWLLERRKGIGGSDVSCILGLNPYRSCLSIYMDKIGAVPVDLEMVSEQAYWGTVLEEPIAQRFAEKHPELTVRRNNNMLCNSDYPFAIANIDRDVRDENGKMSGLEIKTTGLRGAQYWEDDDIPLMYSLQANHYMMVTGWEKWDFAVLIAGQKYIERQIIRDEELIQSLIPKEIAFWNLVKSLTPPDSDGSADYGEVLKSLYPSATKGKVINIPYDMRDSVEGYLSLDKMAKDAKANLDEITRQRDMFKHGLIKSIGDAEEGVLDNTIITYKNVTRKEHFVKESSFRQFRIKQLKEE